MKTNILNFLCRVTPFLLVIVLWRLSAPIWNPAGVLALIPIFYCSFVRPTPWFPLVSIIFCFLIDYRCNLPLFWTSLFCIFYAIFGVQNYLDIQHTNNNALYAFMTFIGVGMFILIIYGFSWTNLVNNLWLFLWMTILYIPITAIDNWIKR